MKEVTKVVYEAFDGEVFDTEAKCAAHERENQWRRLVGLSAQQVQSALSLERTQEGAELGEVIKTLGYQIARAFPSGERAAKRHAAKADNEPELPDPVGRGRPMTAEEAEKAVRA
jgi:hypothetical protein